MTDQTTGEDLPPETIDYVVADEIVRILDEYLDSLKSDHPQSRQELLQRYPHVASQIEACLAGLDFIHGRNPNQGTPQQLGDFRIIREVGRGGMGAVYEAEQVSLGRRVALKVLRFGAAADQGAIQRFQREAETVATLHHTNIVPIFFVGSENGVNFYAMQFIEGRNLADVLSNHSGNLPVDEIASWALQAAEALQHAHHRGVIHRDVKPSNLILDQEGRVWLTDFGLARRIDDVSLSMTGLLIGTPRYMSPEQAAASRNRVDHRTDLFSLGTTFYELLSGRPAFQGGSSHDVIREILTNDPPSIRSLNPSVPRDLETIILKCMAKEPDERYRSAEELTADLRAQIEGRPIHARRSNYVELASRWFKKNKQQVSNVASAVTITLLLTLGMMLAVIAQNHWSRSAIRLEALNPPLVAEFIGSQGISVATETLPMQRPIDLPADDYMVQVSASGDLSQLYQLNLERGRKDSKYVVNLNDHWLFPPENADTGFGTYLSNPNRSVVFWTRNGIRVREFAGPAVSWTLDISSGSSEHLKPFPGFAWPGVPPNDFVSTEHSSSEDEPWVIQDPIDADQDGHGDIIIANPNQAWVMAISGVGKGILWFVGRGEDLKQAAPSSPFRRPSASSAVLYEPLLIDDIDGDGVQDILLTFADLMTQPLPQSGRIDCKRWIEVISGSTGNMLWDYQLSNNLFELNTTEEVPDFFRWFPHRDSNRHQRVGTRFSFGSVLYRSPDSANFSGAHVYQPDRPARVQMGDQWAIALVAGKQLIVIDPKSGKDLLEPVELGSRPGNAVKWADTNGDQLEEMIFLEEIQYLPYGNEPTPKLIVWSLSEQWSMLLDAYWPSRRTWAGGTPDWPIVEDVDRDGAVEIIVPYRRSHRSNSFTGGPLIRSTPIGELAVLEGRSGKIRWSKRFVTVDSEVAYFAAGPDIDGDDCAEIFVTTLVSEHATSGPRMKLFVDAVSGANGKTLWTSSHDLFDDDSGLASHQLSTPSWWNNGHDGWPQLLVKITNRRGPVKSRFFCISAAAGTQSHVGDQIQSLTPMDMDHDGVEDLLVLGSPQETNSEGKSLLHCIRGVGRQMWRRIGDLGDPIADLDGDSVDDLVLSFGDGTIIATNGKNGQPLWKNRPVAATSKLEIRSALSATSSDSSMKRIDSSSKSSWQSGDLNGDAITNLLVLETHLSNRKSPPLHCISGKDGGLIWSLTDVMFREMDGTVALKVVDLDGDGRPEIVWIAAGEYEVQLSNSSTQFTPNSRLCLFVIDGQNGNLKWSKPLSRAYGGQTGIESPMHFSLCNVDVVFADLNGDAIADLIVPFITDQDRLVNRAVSGTDGNVIWERKRAADGLGKQSLENWTSPTLCDLDGDLKPELVLIEPFPVPNSGSISRVDVLVTGIDASNGSELWSVHTDANFTHFSSYSSQKGNLLRPQVVHDANGVKKVVVLLPGGNPKIMLVDGDGAPEERALAFETEFNLLRVLDCNEDGIDEICFFDKSTLHIVSTDDIEHSLWQQDFGGSGRHRLIDVHSRSAPFPPCIVALTEPTNNRMLALDAATGKPVWTCAGPIGRGADSTTYSLPTSVRPIGASTGENPYVFFRFGFINACRQATWTPDFTASMRQSRFDFAMNRVPASLHSTTVDQRWRRELPWRSMFKELDGNVLVFVGWGIWFAISLVVIPLGYALWVLRSRQTSLKCLLLLPLVVAIAVQSLLQAGPSDPSLGTPGSRVLMAFAFSVPIFAITMFTRWYYEWRYRRIAGWIVVIGLLAIVSAVLGIIVAAREAPLVEGERYSWDGWYEILLPAAYTTSWLMLIWMLFEPLLTATFHWIHKGSRHFSFRNEFSQ